MGWKKESTLSVGRWAYNKEATKQQKHVELLSLKLHFSFKTVLPIVTSAIK